MAISSEPPQKNPPLSDQYHKTRRQLMLWSGILFAWELIGIDLEKLKDVGGNAGAAITAIKSPQAIPWVLSILILYFTFRCVIEWNQCDAERRRHAASQIDFLFSFAVAIAAISLYVSQHLFSIRVAEKVTNLLSFESIVIGWTSFLGSSLMSLILISRITKYKFELFVRKLFIFGGISFFILSFGLSIFLQRISSFLFGIFYGILVTLCAFLITRQWLKKRL